MKFETIMENIYKHVVLKPKDQCSKSMQLGIIFAGGYIAGVFYSIVSQPADNLVSFLNNAKGATVGDVSNHFLLFPELCCAALFLLKFLLLHILVNHISCLF